MKLPLTIAFIAILLCIAGFLSFAFLPVDVPQEDKIIDIPIKTLVSEPSNAQ